MAAYLYRSTNVGLGTGFFSNANHMATLLVCSIPFAAALYLANRARSRSQQHSSALKVMLIGALVVLLVGIAINGSLAGLGLTVPALGASLLMLLGRDRRIPAWAMLPLLLLSGLAIALVFTQPMGNDLTSTGADLSISRRTFFANTLRAAGAFAPLGSGLGSFPEIYPLYENHEIVVSTFVNHAHSDLLELMLETGLPGMLLLVAFLLWWTLRAIAVWRSKEGDPYAQAATIASAAILGHSLVDYPLRTAAISGFSIAAPSSNERGKPSR
jgi:O-antigen ligase